MFWLEWNNELSNEKCFNVIPGATFITSHFAFTTVAESDCANKGSKEKAVKNKKINRSVVGVNRCSFFMFANVNIKNDFQQLLQSDID